MRDISARICIFCGVGRRSIKLMPRQEFSRLIARACAIPCDMLLDRAAGGNYARSFFSVMNPTKGILCRRKRGNTAQRAIRLAALVGRYFLSGGEHLKCWDFKLRPLGGYPASLSARSISAREMVGAGKSGERLARERSARPVQLLPTYLGVGPP